MNRDLSIICTLLLLNCPTFALETAFISAAQALPNTLSCQIAADNGETGEYSEKQLQTIASRITVKVIGDNNGASGTLLAKQGNTYLILTNSHVIRGVNSIRLQTSDGKTYPAQIVPHTNFDKYDLALLQFQTNQNYCLVEVAESIPEADTQVIASGYSSEKGQVVFRTGTVQQITEQALKEGYQIGYSSDIEQGMSGGAIINSLGQLIGINGRSAYPILNTGYVYPNGKRPNDEEIARVRKLSWGIPVATFLAQVEQQILTAYSLPLPKQAYTVPATQLTGWLGQLELKAKQITVRIDSSSGGNGSGIIIAKDGDTYTVLTAAHVLCEREDATQPCRNYNYQILAPDGKQYPVEKSTIKIESGVDLGVLKFTATNQNYQVATLANYNPNNDDYMLTAGYPKLGNSSPWRLTMGRIFDKEQGLLQSNESDFQTDSSSRLQTESSLTGGYELVYSSITYGGMSGGAVLDTQGRVIGIHGRAEGEQAIDEKTGDSGSSRGQVQLGYSLGIPISTFLGLTKRFSVQVIHVETTVAPQLNVQQIKSIQEAILSTDVSKENTTASQWLERGNQLWRLRRYDEAVRAFDEAIKLKPTFVYLAYYGKGLTLGSDGKYQESIATLESATKLKPDFVAAWQTLSVAYRDFKQPEKALIAIDKAIQLQPNNPNLYNDQYLLLNNLKRYAEAQAAINKAIELNPRAAFYNNRGFLYFEQKQWKLALADFHQAIATNPGLADAYNNRGVLYKQQKQWDLALADFNQAIATNPGYANAYYNRGLLYFEQKQWDLALADFHQAIATNPGLADAYNNRGVLYKQQKQWDLALADYTKAIAINSGFANAYYNRGLLYFEQKQWDLALADFHQAIATNPGYANAYYNRGVLYKQQKQWDLALADYTKAIAINPGFANAYYNRGLLYFEQKQWDLALADFHQAIAINPQDADSYINRGILYTNQKKLDLALADYNKAIAIHPGLAKAYYNRGLLYFEQKQWDLALADYTKAIAINSGYAKAYYSQGILYFEQKQWDLALADFNQAITINPGFAEAYINRGVLYFEQKQWDLALADFNQAITINPGFAEAYENRGLVYFQKGNKQKAIQDLQQAAQLFYAQGKNADYEMAMSLLKELQK
ncbi:tetratricopeptide repeat protein (plasmid) [Nostoc sp. NIES-2111]|nr:tetratricopeptide repeat protein [Nostoc sp. NIES-2111]